MALNGRYGTARGWQVGDGAPRYPGASVQQGDGMTLCAEHAYQAFEFARTMHDQRGEVRMVKHSRPFLVLLYGASRARCDAC